MTATATSPCLSQRINTSTRPAHTQLNAQIIYLLPFALPPYALDPSLYAHGISHILPIYEALEGAFRSLQSRDHSANKGEETLLEALRKLHIPQLERSRRLSNDLEILRRRCPRSTYRTRDEESPKLKQFTKHIKTTIIDQPHLLLPYTWILYMALFSGGRYIRSTLHRAGQDFWIGPSSEKTHELNDMLSFWAFDGEQDGEDIKADLKRRFAETEAWLSEEQKEEVVREGVFIMETMCDVVQEIALVVGRVGAAGDGGEVVLEKEERWQVQCERSVQQKDETAMEWLLMKHVLPMGMVELITGAVGMVVRCLGPWCRNVVDAEAEVK